MGRCHEMYNMRSEILRLVWLLDNKPRVRTVDAVQLVTQVPAVVLTVALSAPVDAGAVAALELIRAAGGPSWREDG